MVQRAQIHLDDPSKAGIEQGTICGLLMQQMFGLILASGYGVWT